MGPVVHRTAAWTTADLAFGPLYEPHRHPGGAEIGSRLRAPAGIYTLEIDAQRVPSALSLPLLEVRRPGGETSTVPLVDDGGALAARLDIPVAREVTLALRGGGPLILNEIRLRGSTFSPRSGPTR
jgi:hypothetical protein